MRRHDLDWLRVLVFGALILYHCGMFFVPWGWHIKNNDTSELMVWPMLFVNQWRLSILFVISGMGTCFALSKRSSGQYVAERFKRLFLPLVFGMLTIIPPQVYIERLAYGGYEHSYLHFLKFDAWQGIYPVGNISWHHLWFLPYLLIFSIVLTPLFVYLRDHPDCGFLSNQRAKLVSHPSLLLRYCIPLFLAEVLLEPFFNVTHALIGDWFAIVLYITLFFLGFVFIALGDPFWEAIDRFKKKALVIGVFSFAFYLFIRHQEDGLFIHITEALVKSINLWVWIIAIFGYGAQYLNKPSALIKYCNTAVYPFYIFHQTVTVILAYFLYRVDMSIALKFLILTIGTFAISGILYEVVKRIKIIRPLFGLK